LEKEKLKSYFFSSATKNVLLCVATPVEIKGWLMLLDSISEIQDIFQNWELVIVAVNRTNPDALDLWAESKTRGIEGKVRILGQLEHQALAQLYKAADAFVLPSFNEGLANVVLEAAASNLPLLITDVGGHLEVFEKSKSTVIVPPCDKEALKTGLKTLLTQVVALSSDTREIVSQNVGDYLHNAKKLKEYFEKQ
jgi:glycosyltransferase involved in cell wall biosynthesis